LGATNKNLNDRIKNIINHIPANCRQGNIEKRSFIAQFLGSNGYNFCKELKRLSM